MLCTYFDECSLTWRGHPKVPLYNQNVSVGQVVLNELEKNGDKIFQINANNGREMTKNEMRLKTIATAKFFQNQGLTKNDVISVYANNSHHLTPIVFGALTIGIPINSLDPSFKKDEVVHMLRLTNPTIVFCDDHNAATLIAALNELNSNAKIFSFYADVPDTTFVDSIFDNFECNEYFLPPAIEDGTQHIAFIVCSSGTTGLSKGVTLSHAAFLRHINCITPSMGNVILCFSSLYWLSCAIALMGTVFCDLQRIITTEPYSAKLMLHLIERYKVNIIVSAPTAIAQMLQEPTIETTDLSSIKTYLCGGGVLHTEHIDRFNNYLTNAQVHTAYGMSETSGVVSLNFPTPKLNSVGQLMPTIRMKILDDDGQMCGVNVDGELCISTEPKFLGYYGNGRETSDLFDDDGDYIRTGDIGHFDSDGYLFLVDRKKDILKYRNHQISPSEIESVLMKVAGVKNVCVVGIPDTECGDLAAAVIVKESELDKEMLSGIVKEKLVETKQLRGGIYFVDNFPMTASGKILRREVQKLATRLFEEANI